MRCVILPRGGTLGGKLRAAAPFYVFGQCPHGVLGDFDTFAAINRRFRDIHGSKDFGPATFPLNPERHRGLHSIFRTLKPAACDGLSDEILLLGGEVYLHGLNVAGST
jgi:hypothetical protein